MTAQQLSQSESVYIGQSEETDNKYGMTAQQLSQSESGQSGEYTGNKYGMTAQQLSQSESVYIIKVERQAINTG